MKTISNFSTLEKRHNEWIGNLIAYEEQLQNIDIMSAQLQRSVNDLHYQRGLQLIRNEILMQKNVVNILSEEVLTLKRKFSKGDAQNVITLELLIENNRFRERVLKAGEIIFMLKYQVNKFLSIAS